jgi:hypothetical protein
VAPGRHNGGMTVTPTGLIDGERHQLTWADGALTGDERATVEAEAVVEAAVPVGLPGHGRVPPTLDPDDMVGVLGVLDAVFDPGTCELDVVDGPADCGIEYPEGAV